MVRETTPPAPEMESPSVRHRVRVGFRLSTKHAEAVAARMLYVEEKLGRKLSAKDLLEDARNPNSPLHAVYAAQGLWDDAVAAERARLNYARYLLQAIEIVRVDEHGKEVGTPLFRSIPNEESVTGRSYLSMRTVLTDEKSVEEVVAYETAIMKGCAKRIRQIQKLAGFADEIDALLERMAAAGGQKHKRRAAQ